MPHKVLLGRVDEHMERAARVDFEDVALEFVIDVRLCPVRVTVAVAMTRRDRGMVGDLFGKVAVAKVVAHHLKGLAQDRIEGLGRSGRCSIRRHSKDCNPLHALEGRRC